MWTEVHPLSQNCLRQCVTDLKKLSLAAAYMADSLFALQFSARAIASNVEGQISLS